MTAPQTIAEVAPQVRGGHVSPVELLDGCLARIDRLEDRVRAWAHLDRGGARDQAERLAAELKRGEYRGPLHGIPVGVKDIIDVFDMPTGCGSKRWATSYARRDATVVERLRQAGAVILGKTVTTAYASFDPPPTRNPWDAARTPGGSSSGSAAAVACGMCFGALASQTGGSITRPASYCGVASLKPTYGRVSVDGVMPLAPSMDHVGVMANSVRDLAVLFQTVAGPGGNVGGHEPRKELAALPDFLPGKAEPAMARAFETFRENSAAAGWRWADVPLPAAFAELLPQHHTVMAVEAAAYHGDRMRRHPDDYPPNIRRLVERGQACPAPDFANTLNHMRALRAEVQTAFATVWRVWATPATGGPAPTAETTGDPAFNSPWSYTGLPTVSVPFAWTADGLPLAVQLVAAAGQEHHLLATAAMLEADIGFDRRAVPG